MPYPFPQMPPLPGLYPLTFTPEAFAPETIQEFWAGIARQLGTNFQAGLQNLGSLFLPPLPPLPLLPPLPTFFAPALAPVQDRMEQLRIALRSFSTPKRGDVTFLG